jgi:DNA-binding response OmpR family regulator
MTPEPTPVGGAGPAAGAGDASGDAAHPAASDLLRILLLEDNPADARLTRERLRGSAIDCDVATQLRDVTAERLGAVDCALIDLGLPDASGLQALQRIRDLAPELPIVVLTGFADELTGPLALRLGAQDFLLKQDSNGNGIVRAIRFAVARKRLQLALDHEALHELELTDDVIGQLFAIGLAMRTSQQRAAEEQPAVAVRIADHMHELKQDVQRIRSTTVDTEPEADPTPPPPTTRSPS